MKGAWSFSGSMRMQGPVWLPAVNKLFFVSNRLGDQSTSNQHVQLWTLDPSTLRSAQVQPSFTMLRCSSIPISGYKKPVS